jgi:hypothetical protein
MVSIRVVSGMVRMKSILTHGRYSQALCRSTAGWRRGRKAGPADKKVLPYFASVSCVLGATEVRSSWNIDLVYTWINEHDFLF